MNRREFIGLVGGGAVWPLTVWAQLSASERRIGVLMGYADTDPEAQKWIGALVQALREEGWENERNVRTTFRWGKGDAALTQSNAAALIESHPDVIVAGSTPALSAALRETRSIPIVFLNVFDPLGQGFVTNIARPGGNVTGFASFEAAIGGKTVELLKEAGPSLQELGIFFNPATTPFVNMDLYERSAATLNVQVRAIAVQKVDEIEPAIQNFAGPTRGLIVVSSSFIAAHRQLIYQAAAKHRVPAIYNFPYYVREGGFLSYGVDVVDQYRRAGGYVARILKGERPGDLPVQQPTKFELVINLKTAKALGLKVPPTLLARADEVIE